MEIQVRLLSVVPSKKKSTPISSGKFEAKAAIIFTYNEAEALDQAQWRASIRNRVEGRQAKRKERDGLEPATFTGERDYNKLL